MTPGKLSRGASPLRFRLYLFHDITTRCHAGTGHTGMSSPRLLYWSVNFTSVGNFAVVSTNKKNCFGVKSVCLWAGMGSARVVFISSGWHRHVGHETRKKHPNM